MGDAIGLAARRSDQPTFFEAIKGGQAAICQHMTVAVKASDNVYFAVWHPFIVDRSTLRQSMQNTLFVF